MDGNTDSNIPPGTSGPESNPGDTIGDTTQRDSIAGAIDPDAARNAGCEGKVGDDFTAAISDNLTSTDNGTRARRKYTKRKQPGEGQDAALNIHGVEKILYSLHAFASILVPELAIDESESKKLAKAIEGVTDQYKLTLDPKVAAYIDLATVCGMIYGPRAVALYVRKTTEKPKQQPFQNNVQPIRPVPENPTPPRPQPSTGAPAFDPGPIING